MRNIDFSRLETWLHGLLGAAISAGATTGAAVLGSYIGQTNINWRQFGISLGVSSLVAAFLYLKSSPLPQLGSVTMNLVIPPATEGSTNITSVTVNPEKKDQP